MQFGNPRGGQGINGVQRQGMGPEGTCKCSKCEYEEIHTRGIPCTSKRCPQCNSMMVRGK